MKHSVISNCEPRQTNVTWIDMSSGSPVQKNYINGRWVSTGGTTKGSPYKDGNRFYIFPEMYIDCGTLEQNTTFELKGEKDNTIIKHYFIVFNANGDYTLTWPSSLSWRDDDPLEETESGKHYEVSILDGYASYASFPILGENDELVGQESQSSLSN